MREVGTLKRGLQDRTQQAFPQEGRALTKPRAGRTGHISAIRGSRGGDWYRASLRRIGHMGIRN